MLQVWAAAFGKRAMMSVVVNANKGMLRRIIVLVTEKSAAN